MRCLVIFDHSFAPLLNFRNFQVCNFRNYCLSVFRHVSQIMFRKFRKYEFRKASQMPLSQFYICFARFARFRKNEFSKVSQFSVSQEFATRFSFRKFRKVFAIDAIMGSLLMQTGAWRPWPCGVTVSGLQCKSAGSSHDPVCYGIRPVSDSGARAPPAVSRQRCRRWRQRVASAYGVAVGPRGGVA